MRNSRPTLSIVIVTWNTKRLVLQCLASLEPSRSNLGPEIILVDNASSDGTPDAVRRWFPHVTLIQNETNLGFARGSNVGINLSSGDYVCLINSDVEITKGCLEKMIKYMERHSDIGMLGPKMLLPDGTVGRSCLRFPTLWNWFCSALALDSLFRGYKRFGDFMMARFAYDKIEDVEILTGWFWMIRRGALDQVGLLDNSFFMYGEDLDWPKRFHQAGWRVVFYADAEAIHHCAGSSSRAPVRFYVEMNRANLQYFRKHHGPAVVFTAWLITCLHQMTRAAGYGLLYLGQPSVRSEARFKLRRSVACLLWLLGLWGRGATQ